MKIYVASSWRNTRQPHVVHALRQAGHEVFDFKNPQKITPLCELGEELEDVTFEWKEIDPDWKDWTAEEYIEALQNDIAKEAYAVDHGAMEWADACVLVLPCGASAHTELGYFDGARKPGFVLLPEEGLIVELMYKSFTICPTIENVIKCVNRADPGRRKYQVTARAALDIEVELSLSLPVSFDEAVKQAEHAVHSEWTGYRSHLIKNVSVIEADAYHVERTKT